MLVYTESGLSMLLWPLALTVDVYLFVAKDENKTEAHAYLM